MIVRNLVKLIERAEEEEAKQQAPKLVQEDKLRYDHPSWSHYKAQ